MGIPRISDIDGDRQQTSWVGRPLPRREDPELLTGRGEYIADITRPGMLHASFVRSPFPHAEIESIDVEAAWRMPGVHAVLTAEDLGPDPVPQPSNHEFHGQRDTPYYALARDRVRYVGEPVAVVVADSLYEAEDARDEIGVSWNPLPSVGDPELALEDGAPLLYDGWTDNVAAEAVMECGDYDAALDAAETTVAGRFRMPRIFACPLETRGVVADWNPVSDELTLWTSTQILHIVRNFLARVLRLPEHRIRVLVPRVGGGFGAKFHFYPEEVAVAVASRATGRPVRWIEDRLESVLSTVHARGQIVTATLTARRDGTVTGISTDVLGDSGAALHTSGFGPILVAGMLAAGSYDIPNVRMRARGVLTNKVPLGSYRGWGQPQANFVIERLLDRLARQLDVDPIDVRRRNLIRDEQFPYQGMVYGFDSGQYHAGLDRALEVFGYDAWRERQQQMRAAGRHVGIGATFFVENTGLGPSRQVNASGVDAGGYDICRVRVEPGGEVTVYSGFCEMGQGFTNGLAQLCADELGVTPDMVTVLTGDTHAVPITGYGTGASRSAALGGASLMKAAKVVRERIERIAAHLLETSPDQVVIHDGRLWAHGAPERSITMADIGRAAYIRAVELPDGMDPAGLEATEVHDPPGLAAPFGVNIAVVEVDVGTGQVEFLDYVIVHDCGVILNPLIVEGQIHGGVAQGIGMALYEELPYDDQGQPMFGSLVDYLLPTASEIPRMRLDHLVTPSINVPGGRKGVGEGGNIGSPSAVASAVEDALSDYGVTVSELPVTPERLIGMLEAARAAGGALVGGAT